jgi:GH18 family chitinase
MKRSSAVLSLLVLSGCLTSGPNATPRTEATASANSPGTNPASRSPGSTAKAADRKPTPRPLKRVVGYFPDWTHGRDGKCRFTVDDIDPMLFTHLNFAFARVDGGDRNAPSFKLAPFDKTDLGPDGQYAHFVALKKKNPKAEDAAVRRRLDTQRSAV